MILPTRRWDLSRAFGAGAPVEGEVIVSSNKAAVLAHYELSLQLFHGVQGHTDNDQDRGAAEVHLLMRNA